VGGSSSDQVLFLIRLRQREPMKEKRWLQGEKQRGFIKMRYILPSRNAQSLSESMRAGAIMAEDCTERESGGARGGTFLRYPQGGNAFGMRIGGRRQVLKTTNPSLKRGPITDDISEHTVMQVVTHATRVKTSDIRTSAETKI